MIFSERFSRIGRAIVASLIILTPTTAVGQSTGSHSLLRPGNVVVTGFSGTRLAERGVEAAKADADGVTIETNGASLRVLDVSGVTANADPATDANEIAAYPARAVGQVFGVAIDDALDPATKTPAPNIYATASSAYGLNIVLPPVEANGWPRRTLGGDAAVSWMAGQWGEGGTADGKPAAGGPGSVWRIDGGTGQVTLFATIMTAGKPTGAPALGNIAYDARSHQFFVSDLESGLIHRLSLTGQDLGTFDHGVSGRQVAKLDVVPDDPGGRTAISSLQFRADDPNTWGYAAPSRRVWGLNVSAGRLYYAVADGPEIWSVAIGADGGFGDVRREIIVPTDQGPFEISDINFDARGWMYLAQRPPVTGTSDYLFLAAQAPAKVLRYKPDPATNSWTQVPDEYAIGVAAERRQTDGGVAIGYAYGNDGKIDYNTCDGTLWATGDDLDRTPRRTATIGKSDAPDAAAGLNVSGLQGSPLDPTSPEIKALKFADYDGLLPLAPTRGQVGDVRVFKACGSPAASALAVLVEPEPIGDTIDLEIEKIARGPCGLDRTCRIEVRIWNRSDHRYFGPIAIAETLEKSGARLVNTAPSRWQCGQGGPDIACHHPALDIRPGFATSLYLDYRLPPRWPYPEFADCVDFAWLGDLEAPSTIRAVEVELARLKYYNGEIDSLAGPRLVDAIEAYSGARGLAKTSAISHDLIERLFGPGSAIGHDRARPHERACARFHVDVTGGGEAYVPPPPTIYIPQPPILVLPPPVIIATCPVGYWNRGGDCVRSCPWGFRAFGDRCFPEGGNVCRGGWFAAGQCACPNGFGAIREPNGTIVCRVRGGGGPPQCLGGLFERGQCFCGQGRVLRDGRCEPRSPVIFAPPVVVQPRSVVCPPGYLVEGSRCVPGRRVDGRKPPIVPPTVVPVNGPTACGPGRILVDGQCRRQRGGQQGGNVAGGRPAGNRGVNAGQRQPPSQCPPGTARVGGTCVAVHHDSGASRGPRVDRPPIVHGRDQVRVQRPATVVHTQPSRPSPRLECRIVNGKCAK